jgi:arsenite methyltransferase
MDIGKHERPAYDVHILEKMGYKNCIIDPAFGKRVLKEKDLKEAPMFMIMAGK